MLLVSEGLVALVVWLKCENCFVFLYFVRECYDGTAGCHDYTELPPTFLYTLELPSCHHPFFKL